MSTPAHHSLPSMPRKTTRSSLASPGWRRLAATTRSSGRAACLRARLPRVVPGPTSTSTTSSSPKIDSSAVEKRTVSRMLRAQCCGSSRAVASAQPPVTLETKRLVGALRVTPSIAARNGGTAGAIIAEWKACEVCSGVDSMPSSASSRADSASTAAGVPAATQRLLEFSAARLRSAPSSGHRSAAASGTASIRPPGWACISRPRSMTSASASRRLKTPAMQAATNSPRLCPTIAAGSMPSSTSDRARAYSTTNSAGCVMAVCASLRAASASSGSASSSSRRSRPSRGSAASQAASTWRANAGQRAYSPRPMPGYCVP